MKRVEDNLGSLGFSKILASSETRLAIHSHLEHRPLGLHLQVHPKILVDLCPCNSDLWCQLSQHNNSFLQLLNSSDLLVKECLHQMLECLLLRRNSPNTLNRCSSCLQGQDSRVKVHLHPKQFQCLICSKTGLVRLDLYNLSQAVSLRIIIILDLVAQECLFLHHMLLPHHTASQITLMLHPSINLYLKCMHLVYMWAHKLG